MSEGKLPNFAALRRDGAYGRLRQQQAAAEPDHLDDDRHRQAARPARIGHFVAVNEKTGEQLPVTSQMRKVKALWNILSDAGRSGGRRRLVGDVAGRDGATARSSATTPATTSSSTRARAAARERSRQRSTRRRSSRRVAPLIRRPGDLTPEDVAPFVHVSAEELARPFDFDDDLSHFKWALATARELPRASAEHLWQTRAARRAHGLHRGRPTRPRISSAICSAPRGWPASWPGSSERYGDAVEADVPLRRPAGRRVSWRLMDADTTLVVLSDHGFELGALPDDPSKTRDMRRVSERFHRLEGILYLYGNGVTAARADSTSRRSSTSRRRCSRWPACRRPRDMPGRVLTEGLDVADRAAPGGELRDRRSGRGDAAPATSRRRRRRPRAPAEPRLPRRRSRRRAIATSPRCSSRRASSPRRRRRTRRWCATNPDDGALRASLAGALGALGRYDEALRAARPRHRRRAAQPRGATTTAA